jgi:hypothetical protein
LGKSLQRNRYFDTIIKPQPTPQAYLTALAESPYRTHRRMAVALLPVFKDLLAAQTPETPETYDTDTNHD